MSFTRPKNVPSFQDPQRRLEDTVWGRSGALTPKQRAGFVNGVGDRLGEYFQEKDLPMYKDKPHSYATSRRTRPFWRKKRTLAGAIVLFTSLLYFLGLFSARPKGVRGNTTTSWREQTSAWTFSTKAEPRVIDWTARRERVKEAFILSWDAYSDHGWGMREQHWQT